MKKVLSLVLVLTLVLGSLSMAFAGAASDVVGTEYEDAVARLGQLGIFTGYTDGTFKPNNTITRSEFAAVVVRAKGLDAAAQAAKGVTAFADVPADNWASGYINIASKMGFVKGYPNGNFGLNDQITYEQAVTLVVRALGYEPAADARGGYPYGYLIVANENGLLDKVKGTQGLPAPRGLVAQLVDNALEIPLMVQVGYGAQTKWVVSGTEDTKEVQLLDDLGFKNIVGRVTKIDTSKEKITIKNDDVTKTLDVKEGFDFEAVEGLKIKVWYTSDEVELFSIQDTPKFDAVKPADKKVKLIGENKNYTLAKDATLIVNGEEVDQDEFTADYAKVVFDKDGDIIWAKGYTFDDNIVVEKVDKEVIESYGYDELDLEDYTVIKDGKTLAIDDLEKNDVVFFNKKQEVAVVANIEKEGTIERVYSDSFKLDGKTYNINEAKYLDGSKLGDLTTDVLTEMKDSEEKVTVFFNFAGGANGVVLVAGTREIEETESSYFLVTKTTDDFTKRNSTYWTLDVLNSEGKVVAYDVTNKFVSDFNKDAKVGEKWTDVVVKGNIIEIELDKDGDVESVTKLEKVGRYTDKFKVTAEYAQGWKLQPSTLVFRVDGQTDLEKLKVMTLEEAAEKFSNILKYDLYLTGKGRVAAIYAEETDAKSDTATHYGLVDRIKYLTGTSKKADITIIVKGEKKVYATTQKLIEDNKIKEDTIIKFEVGNKTGEVEAFGDVKSKAVTVAKKGINVGDKTINNDYELMNDAVIYDAGDDFEELRLRDLEEGDKLVLYFNGTSARFVNYVVKDGETKDSTDEKSNFGGAYTVRGNVWVTLDGTDYLYGGSESASELNRLYKDKVVKYTTKTIDGDKVVTNIEIVKDEDPGTEDPGTEDPKELTAEATVDTLFGVPYAQITLSDSSRIGEVKEVKVNGQVVVPNVKGDVIRVNFGDTIEEIELVLNNGDVVEVTIK